MLTVTLTPEAREVIECDALAAFPNECCGFLYGYEDNTRNITFSQPMENVQDGDQRRRFAISPEQFLDAERFALTQGLTLLGLYHSHPKHPAFPSEHDRVQAMPWFSYLIINAEAGYTGDLYSFVLNEARQFEQQPLISSVPTQL